MFVSVILTLLISIVSVVGIYIDYSELSDDKLNTENI